MCLSRITESYEPPCPMITDGWKQFSGSESKPTFQSFALNGKSEVPLDKWLRASNDRAPNGVKANDGKLYDPGFHVYANEPKSTKGYRRVFVRNISCRGDDSGQEVIIAQEIYVSSDPNGWPPKGNEPKSGGGDGGPDKPRPNPIKKMIDKTIADMKGLGVTPGQA